MSRVCDDVEAYLAILPRYVLAETFVRTNEENP